MTTARATLNHGFDTHPDWAVLGVGGRFEIPVDHNIEAQVFWRFTGNGTWSQGIIRNQRQADMIFAYPIASSIVRRNLDLARSLNPGIENHRLWATIVLQAERDNPRPPFTDPFEDDPDDEEEDDEEEDEELVGEIEDPEPMVATEPEPPVAATQQTVTETTPTEGEIASLFDPPVGSEKLFCITFNGTPLAFVNELREAAQPISESFSERMIAVLWKAQWEADPDRRLDEIEGSEPVLAACIGYARIPSTATAIVAEIPTNQEIAEQPVGALIVKAAAGALLSGGMSNHFSFTENGALVINPENPPTLEQGYQMMGRIFSTEDTGERLKNFSRWTQGALIAEMQRFFGDAFQWDAVCEATERTYNTLSCCLNTYLRWGHRKLPNLSFTHYKEIEFSTITEEQKEWVVQRSSDLGLTVAEQRKLTSYVRTYGTDGFAENMPQDRDALMERLETRSVNRNYLFMLQGAWYEYRGPFEHIPNGASQILNSDTRQVLDREGNASRPATWVPVGIEVPAQRGHATVNENNIEEARQTGERPRRSHGGRTQHADIGRDTNVTTAEADEATRAADQAIQQAQEAENGGLPAQPFINDVSGQSLDQISNILQGEARARYLVNATGVPRRMPLDLADLMMTARLEAHDPAALTDAQREINHFQVFFEALEDYMIPF